MYAQTEVVSHMLMAQVGSFILFRKQEIDRACAIAVIILSSLNQPYWIPQAVAVPEARAWRKIDFLDRKRMRAIVRKRRMGEGEERESTKLSMESFERRASRVLRSGSRDGESAYSLCFKWMRK